MFKVGAAKSNCLHMVATFHNDGFVRSDGIIEDHGQAKCTAERGDHPTLTFWKKDIQLVRVGKGDFAAHCFGKGGKMDPSVRGKQTKEQAHGAIQKEAFYNTVPLGFEEFGASLGGIGGGMVEDLVIDMAFLKTVKDG